MLEKKCSAGNFALTVELGPPRGNDRSIVERKASFLRGCADAVNVTDNQTAIVRMSSVAASALLLGMGIEPVLQMVTRDRNRIALLSDILGAAALGIKNVLCLSGDHQVFGNHPFSKNVYDVDSVQLISMISTLRDRGVFPDTGEPIKGSFEMFIGAADAPFSEPLEFRPFRLKKKIDAGADFIQTQCIFDVPRFAEYMGRLRDLGLTERAHILAGVMPLKSSAMTEHLANNVPGVVIPDRICSCMSSLSGEKAAAEGIKICCDLIHQLREIPGVRGIHLMAIEWEHRVPEILEQAGLASPSP